MWYKMDSLTFYIFLRKIYKPFIDMSVFKKYDGLSIIRNYHKEEAAHVVTDVSSR